MWAWYKFSCVILGSAWQYSSYLRAKTWCVCELKFTHKLREVCMNLWPAVLSLFLTCGGEWAYCDCGNSVVALCYAVPVLTTPVSGNTFLLLKHILWPRFHIFHSLPPSFLSAVHHSIVQPCGCPNVADWLRCPVYCLLLSVQCNKCWICIMLFAHCWTW